MDAHSVFRDELGHCTKGNPMQIRAEGVRRVNSITTKDSYPLPDIQELFDTLQGAKYFTTLDLRSGYWQVDVDEEDIPKTAFTCHRGLFEFTRLPFR